MLVINNKFNLLNLKNFERKRGHRALRVYIEEIKEFRDLKVIGEYMKFQKPIVEFRGQERQARLLDLETMKPVCEETACLKCESPCKKEGCRHMASDNVEYVI